MGANPYIVDNSGITTVMRVAFTMPTLIRDVFDKLCTEDLLEGKWHGGGGQVRTGEIFWHSGEGI